MTGRVLGFRPDFIEHQLAHAVRDPNGRAYNRTAFLPEQRVMMQEWADYLDRIRTGGAADKLLADPTDSGSRAVGLMKSTRQRVLDMPQRGDEVGRFAEPLSQ